MPVDDLYVSSLEKYYLSPLPIFYLVVCFDAVKHHELFVTLSLLVTPFANIFLPISGLYFHLLFPLLCISLLGLSMSYLFIFCFVFIILGEGQKRYCYNLCQRVFLLFFSRSFIVFGLTVMSLMHFEIIFVCRVKEWSDFIFLHVAVQFSKHHLLKRLSFQHLVFCILCHKLIGHGWMGCLGDFYPATSIYISASCASPILFFWL